MSGKSSFVVYIDESGDEGFSFSKGSSDWFILSAIITRKKNDISVVKLVDSVRALLNKPPKKPLHFRDLRHEHRVPYIDAISKSQLRTVSVLIHKPSLKEPEKFQKRYILYFYGVRLLLERVSWLCRDHLIRKDPGDGSAEIIFSNRSGMSYKELREYLALLPLVDSGQRGIEWKYIDSDSVKAYSPGKRMGLQIADAVAGSTYYSVQPTEYGYTEDRYLKALKPVIYHHKGCYIGNGLKIWPREVMDALKNSIQLEWIPFFEK